MDQKIFVTWTKAGVRYLGIRDGNRGWHILDENGNNYGAWMEVDTFRNRDEVESYGKARLAFQCLPS